MAEEQAEELKKAEAEFLAQSQLPKDAYQVTGKSINRIEFEVPKVMPSFGDTVLLGTRKVELNKPLFITPLVSAYVLDDFKVVKIFSDALCGQAFIDSISDMVKRDVHVDRVEWPMDVVKNTQGEIVGIVCSRSNGIPLNKALTNPKLYLAKWNRLDLVNLAIDFLKMLCGLHQYNIFMGAAELNSILVNCDTRKLFFINTENMQLGDNHYIVWPGSIVPPQLTDTDASANEITDRFLAADIVFRILFLGKSPFVRNRELGLNLRYFTRFRFPTGVFDDICTPQDSLLTVWNYMPEYVRMAFAETLCHGYHDLTARESCTRWLNILEQWGQELAAPDTPKAYLELMPKQQQRIGGKGMKPCKLCGCDVPEKDALVTNGLCHACFNERGKLVKCDCCGTRYVKSYRNSAMHPNRKLNVCRSCSPLFTRYISVAKCASCGIGYPVSAGSVRAFGQKAYEYCPHCITEKCQPLVSQQPSDALASFNITKKPAEEKVDSKNTAVKDQEKAK